MRVATLSVAGERRVGLAGLASDTIASLDLPQRAEMGVLALIEQNCPEAPRSISPIPLGHVELDAPIPRPRRAICCLGKKYYDAHEFAKSGLDFSAAAGAIPKDPITFSKGWEWVVANRANVIIDSSVKPMLIGKSASDLVRIEIDGIRATRSRRK